MKNRGMGVLKNKKGFTLIELIMVIVILGILAAVAIPKYVSMKGDAADASARGITGALRGALSVLYAENLLGGTNGAAYDMTNIVSSAQVSGVEGSGSGAAFFTATIGGALYSWTLVTPSLPSVSGSIIAVGHTTW